MIIKNMPPQVFSTDSENFDMWDERVHPDTNISNNKPTNGLWTSTYYPEKISAWVQWNNESKLKKLTNHFLLIPKPSVKVFRPECLSDLQCIPQTDASIPFPIVDYRWYSKKYDGFHIEKDDVHMGESFALINSLSPFTFWDCESTVWFNYKWIDEVKKL